MRETLLISYSFGSEQIQKAYLPQQSSDSIMWINTWNVVSWNPRKSRWWFL